MERLTWKRSLDGHEDVGLRKGVTVDDAILRLADYEDTGLVKHIKKLAQAEKNGRLVVLPVPVGTGKLVYGLTDPDMGPQRIASIACDYLDKLEIWDNPSREVVVEVDGWEIGASDVGKTIFLTEQEAETALGKEAEHADGHG